MRHSKYLFLVIVFAVAACQSTYYVATNQSMLGTWKMVKVIESGEDVSEQHNPEDERVIEFLEGGKFISDGKPFGRNTGTWLLDESVLGIDSDAGEDDDSQWSISIQNSTMTWRGLGSDFAKNFEIIYERIEL